MGANRSSRAKCIVKVLVCLSLLVCWKSSLWCQSAQNVAEENKRTYKLLREDEDWRFLADPGERTDWLDRFKYIPLRQNNSDMYFSLGGEIRESFESDGNDNWGQQGYQNRFFLQRYMLNASLQSGKHLRSFVQFKSGLEEYRVGGARPIDEKKIDFEAAFVDLTLGSGKAAPVLRVGRQ